MPRTISIPVISYEQTAEPKEELLAAAFDWLFEQVAEKRTGLAIAKQDINYNNKDLPDDKSSNLRTDSN